MPSVDRRAPPSVEIGSRFLKSVKRLLLNPEPWATKQRNTFFQFTSRFQKAHMKHIWRLGTIALVALSLWIALLNQKQSPHMRDTILLLPLYAVFALGCYGLAMVGYGLMVFPTCPHEADLLKKDVAEAKKFLEANGIDVS